MAEPQQAPLSQDKSKTGFLKLKTDQIVLLSLVLIAGLIIFSLFGTKGLTNKSSTKAETTEQTKEASVAAKLVEIVEKGSPQIDRDNAKLLINAAQDSNNNIEIKDCKMNPMIAKTTKQPTLTFKNSDPVAHRLIFDKGVMTTVPAGQSIQFKVSNITDIGMYHIICETKIEGLLIVN